MNEPRHLIKREGKYTIDDPNRPLSDMETLIVERELDRNVEQPYKEREQKLDGIFRRIITAARIGTDNMMRGELERELIDEISGTWYAMRTIVAGLPVDVQGMDAVGRIVKGFLIGLAELHNPPYDGSTLRRMAREFERRNVLPQITKLPGRKKGSTGANLKTMRFGSQLNEYDEAGYGLAEAVQAIMKQLRQQKKLDKWDKKFLRQMDGKDSQAQAKAATTMIKGYKRSRNNI